MTVSIRNASKADVPEILELLYELGRPRPKRAQSAIFKKRILQHVNDRDKKILVATYRSELVGVVSMMFLTRLNRLTPELYIPELIVSKKYRRLGVGRLLMGRCIRIAKSNKCFRIRLESGNKRVEAHKFYPKIGFEQNSLSYSLDLK